MDRFGRRSSRVVLGLAAMVAYALFCLVLLQRGYLAVTPSAGYLLLGVWSAGTVLLLLLDDRRFDAARLTVAKAIWFNIGVILTALLIPHPIRLLLLVAPLFGILYTALRLDQAKVIAVSGVTWVIYCLGALALGRITARDLEFELLVALAFSLMVGVMLFMAIEITALRSAFERRSARLNTVLKQLSQLAMRDELTGLYNRRYIMDLLERQKALADRHQVGFTLCYCDLDHFKQINDRFGHPVGDGMLQGFASVTREVVRSTDFVARLGGEEFLLVLVGADLGRAEAVARRLCNRTRQIPVPVPVDYTLTVSVGIASFVPGERVEDVIQRADFLLYQAKSRGRDQIVTSGPVGTGDLKSHIG